MELDLLVNNLQEEIDSKLADIKADSYQMSIGELAGLYQGTTNNGEAEIDLHPEFQRFFQWTQTQKTRLIESILLGIPLPPIFVAQRIDGVWDVIDGTQRLSTIFQFMGILKDENGQLEEPLVLEGTKYLPSLKNKVWHDVLHDENSLSNAQKLYIKRAKLDLKIILRGSDKNVKYEMFNRLNTGGTKASDQDVRNCILVMENPKAYQNIKELAEYQAFRDCVVLSEKDLTERYDLELVLRFLILRNMPIHDVNRIKLIDLSNFLTDEMIGIIKLDTNQHGNSHYWNEQKWEMEIGIFKRVFDKLKDIFGENSFRRYDSSKSKHTGSFTIYAFEIIALGLGHNIQNIEQIDIQNKVNSFWSNEPQHLNLWRAKSANSRIPQTIQLGRNLFSL